MGVLATRHGPWQQATWLVPSCPMQLGLDSRIIWHWAKFQRHHNRPHHKAGKRRPSVDFKAKWGPMVVFDNQGKTVSLALPTKKQE